MASSVAGFNVVPTRFTSKSKSGHILYYKEHNVRGTSRLTPADRTIFVLNVPPYCNKECFERLFGDCGKVDAVYLQDKPTAEPVTKAPSKYFSIIDKCQGFKVAYVVFKTSSAVEKAMSLTFSEPFILAPQKAIATGYKKWCVDYQSSTPKVEDLQKDIDTFMQGHDNKIEKETKKAKLKEGKPDPDGWITVTRKTAKKQKPVARREHIQKQLQEKEKQKREDKELLNFYTFQMRETKREHIAELRRKFEDDKARIAQMKEARRFKPY